MIIRWLVLPNLSFVKLGFVFFGWFLHITVGREENRKFEWKKWAWLFVFHYSMFYWMVLSGHSVCSCFFSVFIPTWPKTEIRKLKTENRTKAWSVWFTRFGRFSWVSSVLVRLCSALVESISPWFCNTLFNDPSLLELFLKLEHQPLNINKIVIRSQIEHGYQQCDANNP